MDKAFKYLNELIKENDKVVVAVSGGPDSMFLLHLLCNIKKNKNYKLIVAHINHNVRKESADEKLKIEDYCKINNIIFEYLKIEKYPKENFHDYARKVRYNFFDNIVNKYKAKYLLTAHHGDDLMETILMRIVRGSSFNGYSGFNKISKYKNYFIVRPLIELTKQEINDYMDIHKLWYAIDNSNCKDVYTRNRFRKYVVPQLKKENPNVHLKFLSLSEKINDISNFLEEYTDKVISRIYYDKKINIQQFIIEKKAITDIILYRILLDNYHDKICLISYKNIGNIYKVITSAKSNMKIDLPLDFEFIKSYNFCYLKKKNYITDYKIEINDLVKLDNGRQIEKVKSCNLTDNNVIYLNSDNLNLPLYVRNRKIGDKIKIKNFNHYKKVKDIFIEAKISLAERDNYPIVVDSSDEIIWIPGLKKSYFDSKNDKKYDIILKYY